MPFRVKNCAERLTICGILLSFMVNFHESNNSGRINKSFLNYCLQRLCIGQFQLLTSLGRSPGIRTSFCSTPSFSLKNFAQGPGFRSSQIFPKIDKNLQCIFIFSQCFQEERREKRLFSFSIIAFVSCNTFFLN